MPLPHVSRTVASQPVNPQPRVPTVPTIPLPGSGNPPAVHTPTTGVHQPPTQHGPQIQANGAQDPSAVLLQQAYAQLNAVSQQLAHARAHPAFQDAHGTSNDQNALSQVRPVAPNVLHPQNVHHAMHIQNPMPIASPSTYLRPPIQQPNPFQQPQTVRSRFATDHTGLGPDTLRPNSAPPSNLNNSNTVVREHVGPNGERWQTITQTGTFHVNHQNIQPLLHANLPHAENLAMPRSNSSPGSASNTAPAGLPHPLTNTGPSPASIQAPFSHQLNLHPPSVNITLRSLQQTMNSIESIMNSGAIPSRSLFDAASTHLQSIAANIPNNQYQYLAYRHATLVSRASGMLRDRGARIRNFADQAAATQRSSTNPSPHSMYLLSSPGGLQALVLSPSGFYVSPAPVVNFPVLQNTNLVDPFAGLHQPVLGVPSVTAGLQHNNDSAALGAPNQAIAVQQAHAVGIPQPTNVQPAQQVQQAPPNQGRDIVRIIIPLGGHLWLLIRLFGFVYFFTHGASWQRTILLSLGAVLLFVAQTGVFRPFLQHVWDPIRGHAEALVPLAGDEQPRRPNADRGGTANPPSNSNRPQNPTPQETAERLLQERQRRDEGLIRQAIRRIERAVALFIASLVPGVGERHIAAREAAEAARQAEQRAEEERRRQEEEEQQQQAALGNEASGSQEHSGNQDSAGANNSTRGESSSDDPPPPPLIEV